MFHVTYYQKDCKPRQLFYGGIVDCRNYLFNLIMSYGLDHYIQSPNIIRLRVGYFKVEEVDFYDELDKLKALANFMDICTNISLDWSDNAHSLTEDQPATKCLRRR